MTRAEHLEWAKKRALDELESGNFVVAITSMLSDLGKHPELERSQWVGGMLMSNLRTREQVKTWIEGFN